MGDFEMRRSLSEMSLKRFPNAAFVSSEILGEKLNFPNGKTARNRFLKAAMTERLSIYSLEYPKKHGIPTENILNVYDKWGHGQYGMTLTANVLVDPTNLEAIGNANIFKEGDSSERRALFTQWAQKMKQDGSLAIGQLSHAGRQTPRYVNPTPWSASDIQLKTSDNQYGKPIALTTEQVKTEVIDRFVFAAKFSFECGFDGVELHGAHGYILSQFTSPTTNKRTDKYGGSLENRNRIILEIYDEIRKEIPSKEFLIGLKTNSVEFQSEGTTLEDAKEMCRAYEERGFDFVELSGGTAEKFLFNHERESTKKREAFFAEFAEQIRPVFKNTVVYLTGGFRTVGAMVDAIERNTTQGIGLGRPVTAEPDLPKKILNGEVRSAVKDEFNQNEMGKTIMASCSQIEQMGRKSLEGAGGNVMDQISDFSDGKLVEQFDGALLEFMKEVKEALIEGRIPKSIIVFN
uniref:Oxidored_FMN domain-containing protein n=1 Tax=Caenorhabditis tropicalis TaxID=1561998 RepID=A0A1I7TT95_9PELO